MIRVRNFQDLGVNKRQVRANGDPVVQEPGILQFAVCAVDVFLVERPANPLRCTALELAFDVIRMDGFARILNHGVPQNLRGTRVWVHLHITDMAGKGDTGTIGNHLVVPGNGPARGRRFTRNFLQCQLRKITILLTRCPCRTIFPDDLIDRHIEHHRRTLPQDRDRISRGKNRRHAR